MIRFLTRHHDAWMHAAGALALTFALITSGLSPHAAIAWNAAIWFAREWDQTRFARPPWHWSRHKHIEWIAPALAGGIVALVLGAA